MKCCIPSGCARSLHVNPPTAALGTATHVGLRVNLWQEKGTWGCRGGMLGLYGGGECVRGGTGQRGVGKAESL